MNRSQKLHIAWILGLSLVALAVAPSAALAQIATPSVAGPAISAEMSIV